MRPLPENADDDMVYPTHMLKNTATMDEDINGKEVEHVVVDQHPFELITRTCWEMEGADKLRFPQRLWEHRAKVNAVTRGQPGQYTSLFDGEMWLDLDYFFKLFNKMLPKGRRRSLHRALKNFWHYSVMTTNVALSSAVWQACSWQPVKG